MPRFTQCSPYVSATCRIGPTLKVRYGSKPDIGSENAAAALPTKTDILARDIR